MKIKKPLESYNYVNYWLQFPQFPSKNIVLPLFAEN